MPKQNYGLDIVDLLQLDAKELNQVHYTSPLKTELAGYCWQHAYRFSVYRHSSSCGCSRAVHKLEQCCIQQHHRIPVHEKMQLLFTISIPDLFHRWWA